MKYLHLVLCIIPCILIVAGETSRKINLEDIERDNILSEKRAKSTHNKDILEVQQSQNYQSTNLEYYREQLKQLQELQEEQRERQIQQKSESDLPTGPGGEAYATQAPAHSSYNSGEEDSDAPALYRNQQEQQQVQYVTVTPSTFQYQTGDKAVHEESSHTYSAPSRHSLARPIAPTVSKFLQQHPQPRYVYVQTNSVQPKSTPSHHAANDIEYVDGTKQGNVDTIVRYSHDEDLTEKTEQSYQPEIQDPHQIQHIPYIAQGPSQEQSYVTMVEIPSHYAENMRPIKFNPSVITYSHSSSAAVTPVVGGAHQTIQYLPQTLGAHPTGALQYVNTEDDSQTFAGPQQYQDVQYADSTKIPPSASSDNDGSNQLKYAPNHPERTHPQNGNSQLQYQQPQLQFNIPKPPQYIASQRVVPLQHYQYAQQSPINVQPLHHYHIDPFRQPKSLLDSYIPSWVIVQQRQRSLDGAISQQQHFVPQQQQYNTIAYSTQQQYHGFGYDSGNHLKRSTKLTKVEKN